MWWRTAELIHIRSTWKQNGRFVQACETWLEYVITSPMSQKCSVSTVQEYKPIGTAHNRRAQPFVAAANIDDKHQVVSTSYNTPIGLYSSGNIQDAMEGQVRGFVHPKPARWLVFMCSLRSHMSNRSIQSSWPQKLTASVKVLTTQLPG